MLRRRAMDLLARREHTRQELQQKLLTRLRRDAEKLAEADDSGPAETESANLQTILNQVLDKLEAEKLLSDVRFAESFVTARSHRGYGPRYIRHQLKQKQLDETLLQNSLGAVEEEQWLEQLTSLVARKLGDGPMPVPPDKEYLRLQRFVLARGFTLAQWHQVQKLWAQRFRN